MSNKMDRQGSRTPAELEYKYNFGKSFAEVMGIAVKAKETAETANSKFDNMTQEQIFSLLTEDGENQGLFRDDNGNVYINASYIVTGKIQFTKEIFIEPGTSEAYRILNHVVGTETIPEDQIPLYDFDGSGDLSVFDATLAMQCAEGMRSLADWSGAKKTTFHVSIDFFDEENTIRYTGSDMWGKTIDHSIGINSSRLKTENGGCMYREDGSEKEWLNPPKILQQEYRTAERHNGEVVYTKLLECDFTGDVTERTVTTLISFQHKIVGINYVYDNGHSVTAQNPDVTVSLSVGTGDCYDIYVSVPSYGVVTVEIKYT